MSTSKSTVSQPETPSPEARQLQVATDALRELVDIATDALKLAVHRDDILEICEDALSKIQCLQYPEARQ